MWNLKEVHLSSVASAIFCVRLCLLYPCVKALPGSPRETRFTCTKTFLLRAGEVRTITLRPFLISLSDRAVWLYTGTAVSLMFNLRLSPNQNGFKVDSNIKLFCLDKGKRLRRCSVSRAVMTGYAVYIQPSYFTNRTVHVQSNPFY